MTPKQKLLLDFLRSRANDEVQPSLMEMARAVGVASKSNVHAMLVEFERAGLIVREPHRARAIRLADRPCATATTADLIAELRLRGVTVTEPDCGLASRRFGEGVEHHHGQEIAA